MEAFLVSTSIVALAEMGDKTQLLSLVLAARFRRPWPIVAGIFVATLLNHMLAGAVGAWVTTVLGPQALRWGLGLSFIAMAAWMLIPDKLDEDDTASAAAAKKGKVSRKLCMARSARPAAPVSGSALPSRALAFHFTPRWRVISAAARNSCATPSNTDQASIWISTGISMLHQRR